jgi:NMD protein affecting ribosome stability and mRNA decay
MHNGQDIYVAQKKHVEEILRSEGYKFKRTVKLVGQKEGIRLYRQTFIVRLQ